MDTESVGQKTEEALAAKGYCFWRCEALNNEPITIIKTKFLKDRAIEAARKMVEKGRFKEMPAIYTLEELTLICDSDKFKLIHEVKKLGVDIEEDP